MQPRLKELIHETVREAGIDTSEITSKSRLREDLGFDSLELAVLTAKIEAEYDVDIFANGIVTTVSEIEAQLPPEVAH